MQYLSKVALRAHSKIYTYPHIYLSYVGVGTSARLTSNIRAFRFTFLSLLFVSREEENEGMRAREESVQT